MMDNEFTLTLFSNIAVAITFGSLLALYIYFRRTIALHDPILKKKRLFLCLFVLLLCLVSLLGISFYGNPVYIPIH
jgi:hypothetical protein